MYDASKRGGDFLGTLYLEKPTFKFMSPASKHMHEQKYRL